MHTYRIDAYLLDADGQHPTFEQTQYADSPEQARLKYKFFDDQRQTDPETGEPTATKKYLTRLLLAGYTMCENPAQHFAEFGL